MSRWRHRRINQGTPHDGWQVFESGTLAHVWTFSPGDEASAKILAQNLNRAEAEKNAQEEQK